MAIKLERDALEMRKIYANTLQECMQENPLVIELDADLMSCMTIDTC